MTPAMFLPEKVKAFTLLAEGFTVSNELLTPTLKLRRSKIVERYSDTIEAVYASNEERLPMVDTVLLTGATGYIGASLLHKWLESSEAKLMLLVRGKRDEGPHARIERVLAETYAPAEADRHLQR